MKKYFSILLFFCLFLFIVCASTDIDGVVKPNVKLSKYNNVLVFCNIENYKYRKQLETEFQTQFSKNNIKSFKSLDFFSPLEYYTEEDLQQKFGALYNAFQYGAPPHAGMAPGVDRMIMLLCNEENIREVIPFPMNGNAQDLMCGAPGEVTEMQLREVHIKVRK